MTITAELTMSSYGHYIADVIAEPSASSLGEFAEQVSAAATILDRCGVTGADALDDAAASLLAADISTGQERAAHVRRAARQLADVPEIVAEYRLML
ncbi:hypothetical protein OG978_29710 [Streptomyces sp. NBC_01591]|uniref:hypothetical protein n=1 Tax=Streptomyces sp. NBC_01591 TaxID=2975888 RepID=UPI002DD96EC5|nr:hypothetical protein [Streptomyces sp. NBC_01591]WSD71192.1 hypothetical protein OG978_29710 [Streptomyces sp. NBC_01591]